MQSLNQWCLGLHLLIGPPTHPFCSSVALAPPRPALSWPSTCWHASGPAISMCSHAWGHLSQSHSWYTAIVENSQSYLSSNRTSLFCFLGAGAGGLQNLPLGLLSLLCKCSQDFWCSKLHLSKTQTSESRTLLLTVSKAASKQSQAGLFFTASSSPFWSLPVSSSDPHQEAWEQPQSSLGTVDQMVSLGVSSVLRKCSLRSGPPSILSTLISLSLSPSSLGSARVLFSQVSRWLFLYSHPGTRHALDAVSPALRIYSLAPACFSLAALIGSWYIADLCVVCLLPDFC